MVAGVSSASADEDFGTLAGISAFDSLAGIQAIPLDTDEMAAITAAHTVKYNVRKMTAEEVTKGHEIHYVHGGKYAHRVIYTGVGGPKVYDNFTEQGDSWTDPFAATPLFSNDIHISVTDTSGP